jgi:acyl-ACP--UDP-N-acetylglucosamine O-acyltransferase
MPKGNVHPTAIIEDGAKVGSDVRVGPYCVVGSEVVLGDGVELLSHVVVAGRTTIGARTRIFPFASIGHQPQDLKYKGEPSTLAIGSDCLIREGVTMNPGTEGGGMQTVVGDRCVFLASSHVGHDCRVGDNVIFSNNVMIAGHVTVGDFVIIGGGAAVIQFMTSPASYVLMLGVLLEMMFGWPFHWALLVGAVVATGYSLRGGLRSVVSAGTGEQVRCSTRQSWGRCSSMASA